MVWEWRPCWAVGHMGWPRGDWALGRHLGSLEREWGCLKTALPAAPWRMGWKNVASNYWWFLILIFKKTVIWACCCWVTSVVSDSVRPHRWQPTRLPRPWDSAGKNTGVGCHFLLQCMKVKSESEVAQLCPTLQDPMDCSLPASSVHGIFQARVLEWGAIAFSVVWAYILSIHPSGSWNMPAPAGSRQRCGFDPRSGN